MHNSSIILLFILLFSGSGVVFAAGPTIQKISITGQKKIEADAIKAKIQSKEGIEYTQGLVTEDVKAIFSLGYFNDVKVTRELRDRGVELIYEVKEKPTVIEIDYKGNSEIKDEDLKEHVSIKPFEILNSNKVRESQEKLQKVLEEKGYLLASVQGKVETVVPGEKVKVTFEIEENAKVKVKKIRLLGNNNLKDNFLKPKLATREGGFFSFMSGSGGFKQEAFERDMQILRILYFNEGYVQARIEKPQVFVTPDKTGIYITIRIDEGDRFKVGDIDFAGDILFSREELKEATLMDEKEYFSSEVLQKDLSSLQAKYGDMGYAFTNVMPRTNVDSKNKKVDIIFEFDKGNKVYFGRINVVGNTRTRDKVVRRELKILEGELYNETRKRESVENIQRLGFFEEVIFKTSSSPDTPEKMDIDIQVKERHTGNIQLGMGVSNREKFTMNGQLNETNFLGKGQRLGATLNHSAVGTHFNLNFTEPNVNDTQWLFGGDLYQSVSNRDDFNQQVSGGAVRVGHPLGDYVNAIVRYRLDRTTLTAKKDKDGNDITDQTIFPLDTASGVTSSVTGTLEYDRRDDRFSPTKGMYLSTSLENAGLGGDLKYIKSINTFRYFQKAFWDVVWRNNVVFGMISSQGDKAPPFSEMFLLGGAFSLRGYPSISVGKHIRSEKRKTDLMAPPYSLSDEEAERKSYRPYGGERQLYYMTELEFPLIADAGIKGAVFFDIGQAEDTLAMENFYSDVGFGFRWFSPIGPLRFEWGFPLNRNPDRHPPVNFEFMIGQPF